jgi:hypothetical protein
MPMTECSSRLTPACSVAEVDSGLPGFDLLFDGTAPVAALNANRTSYCRLSGQPTCASIDFENTSLHAHRSTWPALPFGEPFSHREYAHRLGLGSHPIWPLTSRSCASVSSSKKWRCFAIENNRHDQRI